MLFQSAAITGENIICRRLSWWSQQHNIRSIKTLKEHCKPKRIFLLDEQSTMFVVRKLSDLSGHCLCFPMVQQGSFHCQMKQASWINPLVNLYMKMRGCFVLSVSATGSEVFLFFSLEVIGPRCPSL